MNENEEELARLSEGYRRIAEKADGLSECFRGIDEKEDGLVALRRFLEERTELARGQLLKKEDSSPKDVKPKSLWEDIKQAWRERPRRPSPSYDQRVAAAKKAERRRLAWGTAIATWAYLWRRDKEKERAERDGRNRRDG